MRNVKCIERLPFTVKPFQDITDKLVRNDKGNWELDRTSNQITHISVHHSAIEGGSPESYARYHVQTLKWRSIGYHVCIVGDQVFQTNSLLSLTYHTSGHNDTTIGISVSADFSNRDITEDERNNLYASILTCMSLFNIPVENVLGHKEFSNNRTSCPVISMDQVRSDIKNIKMKLDQQDTWEAKITKIAQMVNQFNYFTSLSNKGPADGNAVWAVSKQMELYDVMKEKGYV